MYCTECGSVLKNDAKYCTSCGTKVENISVATGEPNLSIPDQSSGTSDITHNKYNNKGQRVFFACITVIVLAFVVAGGVIGGSIGNIKIPQKIADTEAIMDNIASVDVGDYITFGHYEQDNNGENGDEPIEWQVLDKKDGKILLISRFALDCQQYNTTLAETTWESCSLRGWLNSSFYSKAFGKTEREIIARIENSNPDSYACFESDRSHVQISGVFVPSERTGANGGNITSDSVFLLSYEELWNYFDSDEVIQCIPTPYAIAQGVRTNIVTDKCFWWLRSPGSSQLEALYADYSGEVYEQRVYYGNCAVRPALWITTKKDIEYSKQEKTEQVEIEQQRSEVERLAAEQAEAERLAAEQAEAEQARMEITNASVGECVTFGHYEQDNNIANGTEPIEWKVLAKENGRTLLISRYGLDCQKYNMEVEDITWENCSLRDWLNNNFYYEAFDEAEQNMIIEVTNTNPDSTAHYMRYGSVQYLGAIGGNITEDYVFLLSYEEASDYFESDVDRNCDPTQYAKAKGVQRDINRRTCYWWLRSPGVVQNKAMVAPYSADHRNFGNAEVKSTTMAVRPAIWIQN